MNQGGILLVEDSSSDEKLALLALRRCGVPTEVTVVRDGAEALDYLFWRGRYADRPRALPALVLLDLKLPRVNGLEVLQQVRANPTTRHLPVVILTASKEEEDVGRSYSLGANAYLRKPVDFAEFSDAAKIIGQFWLVLNELDPAVSSS